MADNIGTPQLPALSTKVDREVRRAFDSLRTWFNQVKAQGGFGSVASNAVVTVIKGGGGGDTPDEPTPPAITNLTVSGGFAKIMLSWDAVDYSQYGYAEIWRSESNSLGTAILSGTSISNLYADDPPIDALGHTYYYWVRMVSYGGQDGPWSGTDGVPGSTADNPRYILELLQNSKWKASTYVGEGTRWYPTKPNNRCYICIEDGTTGTTEPDWPLVVNNTINDGTAIWKCEAQLDLEPPFELGLVDGVVKMCIRAVLIADAAINDAMVENLSADKLTVPGTGTIWEAIIQNAKITNEFIGNIIQSLNYEPGEAGWILNKDGTCEFQSGLFRGQVIVGPGSIGAGNLTDLPIASNQLPNSEFPSLACNGSGWTISNPGGWTTGFNFPGWCVPGINVLYVQQFGHVSNTFNMVSDFMAATAGLYYGASAYMGAHRCSSGIQIVFYASDGQTVTGMTSNVANSMAQDNEALGGTSLNSYKRVFCSMQAPANTVYAKVQIWKTGTYLNSNPDDSYLFLCRPQFEPYNTNQVYPSEWDPGPGLARNWVRPGQTLIDGNKIYTGDAYVDTLQIRNNAVIVPVEAHLSTDLSCWTPGGGFEAPGVYLTTPPVDAMGGKLIILVKWEVTGWNETANLDEPITTTFYLLEDSTIIANLSQVYAYNRYAPAQGGMTMLVRTPVSGSHTYSLRCDAANYDNNTRLTGSPAGGRNQIVVIGAKR